MFLMLLKETIKMLLFHHEKQMMRRTVTDHWKPELCVNVIVCGFAVVGNRSHKAPNPYRLLQHCLTVPTPCDQQLCNPCASTDQEKGKRAESEWDTSGSKVTTHHRSKCCRHTGQCHCQQQLVLKTFRARKRWSWSGELQYFRVFSLSNMHD